MWEGERESVCAGFHYLLFWLHAYRKCTEFTVWARFYHKGPKDAHQQEFRFSLLLARRFGVTKRAAVEQLGSECSLCPLPLTPYTGFVNASPFYSQTPGWVCGRHDIQALVNSEQDLQRVLVLTISMF